MLHVLARARITHLEVFGLQGSQLVWNSDSNVHVLTSFIKRQTKLGWLWLGWNSFSAAVTGEVLATIAPCSIYTAAGT